MRAFDEALADDICKRISAGETLRKICSELQLSSQTIYLWLSCVETFQKQYARAKEHQAEAIADEIMQIADDVDFASDNGNAAVQAARLQVDARKWLLSKLLPKRYGERLEQRISDPDGNALKIVVTGIRPTEENT